MKISIRFLFFGLCAIFFLLAGRTAFADENFGVSLTATYTVVDTGNTLVEQKFLLTNKKATVFARQYALEIGSTKIKNVRVLNDRGVAIPANVVTTNEKTSIGITFNDELVGEGKTRSFSILFDDPDTAIISGNILEVYVPKLTNAQQYDNYHVVLQTPIRYGKPVRLTPDATNIAEQDGQEILTFDQLGNKGVAAVFGKKQIFDYTLHYNLENSTGNAGIIEIALPPDTLYQKVIYQSLDPLPQEMARDEDGNWIATYQIDAQKNMNVQLKGTATVYIDGENKIPLPQPADSLTSAQKYWEANDPQIQALAKQYHTPREIYDYVVDHLSYNYNKVTGGLVTRLGALGALVDPKNAACQEFTDLFIAIARANHIPARRATGFAYTENNRLRPLGFVKDVLHAWPEYYDQNKKTWISIDPTWGNTTGGINYFDQFDFNHLVFAINGMSSELPYGAGAYKSNDDSQKDVEVHFGKDDTLPQPNFSIQVIKQSFLSAPFRNAYKVRITNNTGVALYDSPLRFQLTGDSHLSLTQAPHSLDYLLPFQTREISFDIAGNSFAENLIQHSPLTLTLSIDGLSSTHELQTGISTQDFIFAPLVAIGVGGSVVIAALIAWSLLVSRRRR